MSFPITHRIYTKYLSIEKRFQLKECLTTYNIYKQSFMLFYNFQVKFNFHITFQAMFRISSLEFVSDVVVSIHLDDVNI